MILADKLSELRKKNGWTQESLAARLHVSRQAISKWESATSIPDIANLQSLAVLFDVTMDFLVDDNQSLDDLEAVPTATLDGTPTAHESVLRTVTLEEANDYLRLRERYGNIMALGVSAIIVGAIPLILLPMLQDEGALSMAEPIYMIIAGACLALTIGPAIAAFLLVGARLRPYTFIRKEEFDTAYGVTSMVRQRRERGTSWMIMRVTGGITLCIVALFMMIVGPMMGEQEPLYNLLFGGGMMLVALAVYLFITTGMVRTALSQLLQEGDYTNDQKKISETTDRVQGVYWLAVVLAYLAVSLVTNKWGTTWVIWPIAGVGSALIAATASWWAGRRA